MTDAEIIEALECCGTDMNCHRCPAKDDENGCIRKTCQNALELINRQKAEIEKLQADYSSIQSTLAKMSMGVEEAKAEAIKECLDKVKGQICCIPQHHFTLLEVYEVIRKTEKEMVGGD